MTDQDQAVSAAAAAAAAITGAQAEIGLSTGTAPGAPELADTVLDRMSVERRVLGFVTDEVDKTALGPRNTLHSLTYALMRDVNTTHPPEGRGRLAIDGLTVEQIAQLVLDILHTLVQAGLVDHLDDGRYARTEAGETELQS